MAKFEIPDKINDRLRGWKPALILILEINVTAVKFDRCGPSKGGARRDADKELKFSSTISNTSEETAWIITIFFVLFRRKMQNEEAPEYKFVYGNEKLVSSGYVFN